MNFKQILKEIKIWTTAARILPLTALSFVIFEKLFGLDSLLDQTLVVISTIFFAVSAYWWWWTMGNIRKAMQHMSEAANDFSVIAKELKELNNDLGNRKRPKQKDS